MPADLVAIVYHVIADLFEGAVFDRTAQETIAVCSHRHRGVALAEKCAGRMLRRQRAALEKQAAHQA